MSYAFNKKNISLHLDNGYIVGDSQTLLGKGSGTIILSTEKAFEIGRLSTYDYEKMRRIELTLAYTAQIKNEVLLSEHSTTPYSLEPRVGQMKSKLTFSEVASKKLSVCPPDWRVRCKDIVDFCLKSIGKEKIFFEKSIDPKIISKHCKNHFDLGTIRDTLIGVGKLNVATYNKHVHFYQDMVKFWKNCRKWKNLKKIVKKSGRAGSTAFRKEWNRLFVKMEPRSGNININYATTAPRFVKKKLKQLSHEDDKFGTKYEDRSIYKKSESKTKYLKKCQHISTKNKVTDSSKQEKVKSNYHSEEISSLVKSLTAIAHDVESEGFKRMVDIIKEQRNFSFDDLEEMEVDFADLDSVSIRKLQALAKELNLK